MDKPKRLEELFAGRQSTSRLSTRRDVAAAKAFFRKAIKSQLRPPQTITLDGYATSHRAVHEPKADGSLPPVDQAAIVGISQIT